MYEIQDYTNYDPRRSRNGGAYAYYESFEVMDGRPVNGQHSTSAEFDYCPWCGQFVQKMQDHLDRWCYDKEYQPSEMAEKAARLITKYGADKIVEAALAFKEWAGDKIDLIMK